MRRRSFYSPANGVDFYCEMLGDGPPLVIIPDGSNDCGAYQWVSECLMKDFTVLSFDPRGGTRSMDHDPSPVTPKTLADDAAAILTSLGLGPASFYGTSSGGQGVLAMALHHPELCVNAMVHEAALQADAPIADSGAKYFEQIATYAPYCQGFDPGDVVAIADHTRYMALDAGCRSRIDRNREFWAKYYLGSVDQVGYSDEQLAGMKNVDVSVGVWSVAWCVYANIAVAERGGFGLTWLLAAHAPHITGPEALAAYISRTCAKYLP
jgi:pimeloyl-ACP methyl ester carboxylesterase